MSLLLSGWSPQLGANLRTSCEESPKACFDPAPAQGATAALLGADAVNESVETKKVGAILEGVRLGSEIERRGMEWVHMPIPDVSTPGTAFEAKWPEVSRSLRSRLDAGENILVHCRGGLGRAGMIAARLLVETGVEPEVAIERVRAVRPGAIETGAQERWVRMGPRPSRAADGLA
jgi:protein-tyrosine phosphatase